MDLQAAFLYTKVYYSLSDDGHTTFFGNWGFYILMSAVLFATAAWLLYTKAYRYTKLKNSCIIPVDARLFAVDSKFGGRGGRLWNVTYEFYYNERRFLVNNDIWEQTRLNRPVEGTVETIFINPINPNELYDRLADHGRKTGLFCGILMAGIGVFILFIPLFV